MKKAGFILAAAMAAAAVLSACGSSAGGDRQTLKIYNAGEYIQLDLLTKFEEEYNCKIVYETFESNEMMYTKLSSGESYDILVPSDYMIERLIKEDYLQPIDWDQIPNKDNLMPEVMNQVYDEGNVYSVPYFWGTVGILYDTTVVDAADLDAGWDLLMNEKYAGDLYMYDSERDSFMIAMKALGYSMNTDNEEEMQAAYEWLVRQQEVMSPIYAGDDVIDNMISGNKAMAIVYSGDGAYIMSENENLDFLTPSQGTNVWYDAMVMTKDCQNTELAMAFMNFMLDEQNAYENTLEVGYTSVVKSVYDKMCNEGYAGISAYIPEIDNPLNEVFRYQTPEVKAAYADLWTKVKAQ